MLKQADVLAENFAGYNGKTRVFMGKVTRNATRAPYMLHRQVSDITVPLKDAPAYDTIIQAMSGIMMEHRVP
ncbi:hypothetical protein ACNKHR_21835 [Shigella flexneri]